MNVQFKRATRLAAKARIALAGPAGSGKTYTALRIATALSDKVALIDTEHGSASKYAEFGFDVLELDDFHPDNYIKAIKAAQEAGYEVLVIDSASHEWMGKGGCLELKEFYARKRGGNDWAAWADITPLHNKFIEAIHASGMHIIATFRSKMDYMQTEDKKIKKVGMAPITREGGEYEFDVVGELDLDHNMFVTKSRCTELSDKVFQKPGKDFAQMVLAWLNSGEPAAAAAAMDAPVEQAKPAAGHTLDGGKEEYHAGPIPNGRPWSPEKLREVVLERVGKYRSRSDNWMSPPPDGLRGAMVGALDTLLNGEESRHAFLRALFGDPSSKSLDHAQVKVVMEWLDKSDPVVLADEANRLVNAEAQAGMTPML